MKRKRTTPPSRSSLLRRARYISLRDEVYAHYGGYRCACCGVTDKDVLTIDHVRNDGARHRKSLGIHPGGSSTQRLLSWLKKEQYPKGFQILCRNCNWRKFRSGGVLPGNTPRGYEEGGVY